MTMIKKFKERLLEMLPETESDGAWKESDLDLTPEEQKVYSNQLASQEGIEFFGESEDINILTGPSQRLFVRAFSGQEYIKKSWCFER